VPRQPRPRPAERPLVQLLAGPVLLERGAHHERLTADRDHYGKEPLSLPHRTAVVNERGPR
jgi:hypothetical protein